MRRAALVVLILGGMVLSGAPAQAAPRLLIGHHGLAGLLPPSAKAGGVVVVKRDLRAVPNAGAKAHASQSAESFRLSPTAFSPASADAEGVADNPTADQTSFRQDHSLSYEDLQRITGYYQRYKWQPSGSSDVAYFRYMASTFPSASQASNAWQDGVTHTSDPSVFGGTYNGDCTNNYPPVQHCASVSYSATSNGASANYLDYFFQYNQCLAETEIQYTTNLYNSSANQLAQTGVNVNNAAVRALSSACGTSGTTPPPPQPTATRPAPPQPTATTTTTTNFQIVAVRVEKNGSKPDFNLKNPPLRQIKVGTPVYLSVYWNLNSAPSNPQPVFHFSLRKGGKVVKDLKGTISGSYPTGYTFRDHISYTPKEAGNYTLTIDVNLNGQSDEGTTSLKVLSKVTNLPPPPQIRRVTFQLLGLQTLNGGGRPQTTFKPGEVVKVRVNFSVANLSGTTPVEVDRVTQLMVNGQWQSVAFNPQQFDTSGGKHSSTTGFQLSPTVRPGEMRFIVSVTIVGRTQRRIAVIHVA